MATQGTADAMVSGRGQQEAIGGERAGRRRRRGVAMIGALVLALLASVAVSRALPARPADPSAPGQLRVIQQDPDADAYAMAQAARPADTFDWEQWDRTQVAPPQSADPFDWEQHERTHSLAGAGPSDSDSACREPGRSCDR